MRSPEIEQIYRAEDGEIIDALPSGAILTIPPKSSIKYCDAMIFNTDFMVREYKVAEEYGLILLDLATDLVVESEDEVPCTDSTEPFVGSDVERLGDVMPELAG